MVNIGIEETGRVELHLYSVETNNNRQLSNCKGYLMVGEQLRPLPIGSHLDREKGIFYWQPGAGFIGEYQFVFVRKYTDHRDNLIIKIVISHKFVLDLKDHPRIIRK